LLLPAARAEDSPAVAEPKFAASMAKYCWSGAALLKTAGDPTSPNGAML
jgi:hypothetical protein